MDKKENLHAGHRQKMKNRFLAEGLEHFEAHNVLEMILFYAIPRRDTNEIAHRLLKRFGSLSGVFDAQVHELCAVEGIGENAAILIKTYPAVSKRYYEDRFRSREQLPEYQQMGQDLIVHFAGLEHEQVYALFYDITLNLTGREVLHDGDINVVGFSFRKVCDMVLRHNAAYIVLAHNHPRGIPIASSDDLETTNSLQSLLRKMNVIMIDHFIVAEDRFSSIYKDTYKYVVESMLKGKYNAIEIDEEL